MDAHGEVSIYTAAPTGVMTCLFHPSSSALATTDLGASELNQIVGLHWFEMEKPVLIASPATPTSRSNSNNTNNNPNSRMGHATYGVSQALPMGPFHPVNGKQACIAVSKRGLVRLIFQNSTDNRFMQAVGNLGIDSSDASAYISHASLRGYRNSNNTLLLVTYSPTLVSLNVYMITITWTMPPAATKGNTTSKQAPQNLQASLGIQLVATEVITPNVPPEFALTHLLAVPSIPQKNINADQEQKVEVYTVFGSRTGSIVCLYTIQSQTAPLHPSIYSLTTRRNSYQEESEVQIAYKECINPFEPKKDHKDSDPDSESVDPCAPITSIAMASSDMFIITTSCNGKVSINYRGPTSGAARAITSPIDCGLIFENNNDDDSAHNDIRTAKPHTIVTGGLGQVSSSKQSAGGGSDNKNSNGTESQSPVIDVVISPTLFAFAYLTSRGIAIRRAHSPALDWYEASDDNSSEQEHIVTAAIALAARHAAACFSSLSCDDVLSVMTTELAKCLRSSKPVSIAGGTQISRYRYFLTTLLQESHRSVNFSFDLPRDYQIDKLMMHPSLQRLLSMQLVLGTSAPDYQRNIMGITAWTTLNIRLAAFALTFVVKSCGQPKQELTLKITQLMSLRGLIRWCIDFVAYVCQELYTASLHGPSYFYASDDHTVTPDASVVAAIVCTSIPRQLLLYSIRCIRSLGPIAEGLLQEYAKDPTSHNAAAATLAEQSGTGPVSAPALVRSVREMLSMAPVPLEAIERLLKEVEGVMQKTTFTDKLMSEQKLFFEGVATAEMQPVINRLIEVFRGLIGSGLDVSQLYFYDVSWLGLTQRVPHLDVLRKVLLDDSQGLQLRRCTRCGGRSIWSDMKTMTSASANWTVVFQRSCLCGGNWIS